MNRIVIDRKTAPALVRAIAPPPVADFAAEPTFGVAPLEVAFTDRSTPGVTSWQWSFGDGTGSSERAPRHTYQTLGLFDVTLSVRGPSGNHALRRPALVQVVQPLIAAFEFVSPGGVAPVTVQFLDRSSGASSWSWNFGDGRTSTAQNPSHRFTAGGTFQVRLTVGSQGRSATATVPVVIGEPPPVARFSAATVAGLAPLSVAFSDHSLGNVTSWEWDFGDGTGSTQRNPVHVYLLPGLYTVRFRVRSTGGVDTTMKKDFILAELALPLLRSTGPASAAPPTKVRNTAPGF